MSNINFVFFGTSEFAVKTLDILIKNGYIPSLVITAPDKPKGRKMIMTPPPAKVFSQKHNFKIIQPERLGDIGEKLFAVHPDLFIVASYGKVIPKYILDLPKFGTLNVHPSLLPKFRGPSPIQSFILSGEEKTGVTIMLMDEQVDHGAILSQQQYQGNALILPKMEEFLAELGGEMLVEVIPKWINGEIKFQEQNHDLATFTKKIAKEDGLIDLEKDTPETIYRKFIAFQPWPGIYYFVKKDDKDTRVIITDMELKDGKLEIKKVKPEGKNDMSFYLFSKTVERN